MGRSVEVLLRGGLLLAGVLALGLLLLAARWLYQRWQRHAPREPFSLRDLEAMRDTGQLSREEFSRLRRSAMGLDVGAEKGESLSRAGEKPADGTEGAEAEDSPRKDQE